MNSTESDRYQPKSLPISQSILDFRLTPQINLGPRTRVENFGRMATPVLRKNPFLCWVISTWRMTDDIMSARTTSIKVVISEDFSPY
jgi:hypothetical protein